MTLPKGYIIKPVHPDRFEEIEQWAAIGLNNEQIATLLDMSLSAFKDRLRDTAGLKELVAKGRAKAVGKIAGTAFKMAASGKHPSMTAFFLKCKGDWKEKSEVALTDPGGAPLGTALVKVNLKLPDNSKSKRGK